MTVQEHPNDEEFRPVRAASDALDAHLTSAIAELSQEKPVVTAPQPGSFVAQIRAMMDGARADLAKTKEDGIAQIKEAVTEHVKAGEQVKAVTASMVQVIKNETADALAELGQISNFPPA
jgi:hypothetical protein